jgi:hypothetical protein
VRPCSERPVERKGPALLKVSRRSTGAPNPPIRRCGSRSPAGEPGSRRRDRQSLLVSRDYPCVVAPSTALMREERCSFGCRFDMEFSCGEPNVLTPASWLVDQTAWFQIDYSTWWARPVDHWPMRAFGTCRWLTVGGSNPPPATEKVQVRAGPIGPFLWTSTFGGPRGPIRCLGWCSSQCKLRASAR